MKKILFALAIVLACFASAARADGNKKVAFGTISAVNAENRTFDIKGDDGKAYTFQVNPKTELEVKRDFWFDSEIGIKELEKGWWVKVEYYPMNPTHLIADEVDIHK